MSRKHHSPPFVELTHFSFGYDQEKEPLLKDISFTINEGETILLIGPSGSGKSTLALCLNGLYPDVIEAWTKGSIHFKATPIEQFEKGAINQDIGVVFQDPESQFCMVTVEDELAFTLENIQTPRDEMEKKIDEILQVLSLSDLKERPIHELSGGQKQKVALASVLLLEPSLIILDEPTANLDPASRFEFIQILKRLKAERHFSLLIIEHHLDDWLPITDHVVALDSNGEIMVQGRPAEVFYEHASVLIAEGIHLPQVVTTVLSLTDTKSEVVKELPLCEEQLADWLNQMKKTLVFFEKEKQVSQINLQHPFSNKDILFLNDISFSRGKQRILSGIHLSLAKGELVAIVGQNGAGKSTLLQLIADILKPESGERTLLEKKYERWSEREMRKEMGFVFQNPEHQFITDTVFDEVAFGMVLNKLPEKLLKERVQQLLDRFHLVNHQYSNPFSLSGGQKRRLSVATMLDEQPSVLLFDEPTFGQDAQTTAELMGMIEALRRIGTAIVFVTHDMDLVDRYCQRVYVVNEGQVSFNGCPVELWSKKELVEAAQLRLPYRVRMKERLTQLEKKSEGMKSYDYVY